VVVYPARTLLALAVLAAPVALPATAAADSGGTAAPDSAPRARATLLTSFRLQQQRVYVYGRAARVSLTLSGRRRVAVRVHVLRAADRQRVATLDLGVLDPGEHSIVLSGLEQLPEGSYLLHLAGRGLRRGPSASSTAALTLSSHAFPIAGSFDWGGPDARFGAERKGHRHQGQDLMAAEGTPVVAPRGGTIDAVEYQAGGAGNYVVLDASGEDYDYVFMHMRTGSIPVKEGQRVRTGQTIGEVGHTGDASGPHLHFEVWSGAWYTGGHPVDPLPFLRAWAGLNPA
jgi:murein DD-endopeptidase MepM/ murein hydrolase activator NlpD